MLTLFADDHRPTPAELRKHVRDHVLHKWEELADELGLDDDDKASKELDEIREKWKDNKKMAAFKMLKLWLRHYQTSATWEALLSALRKLKLDSAISSIQDHLSGSGKHHPSLLFADVRISHVIICRKREGHKYSVVNGIRVLHTEQLQSASTATVTDGNSNCCYKFPRCARM